MTTTIGAPTNEFLDTSSSDMTRPRVLGAAAAGLAVTGVLVALQVRARRRRHQAMMAQRLRRAGLIAALGFGMARRALARPLTHDPKLTAELGAGLLLEASHLIQRRRAMRGLDWPVSMPAGRGGSLRRP